MTAHGSFIKKIGGGFVGKWGKSITFVDNFKSG